MAAAGPMSSDIPVAAPFSFQKRRGKLEWREMAKLDLDRVNREVWPTRKSAVEIAHTETAVRVATGGH